MKEKWPYVVGGIIAVIILGIASAYAIDVLI